MSEQDEFEARTILTFVLKVFVIKNDDNSLSRMVDARFTYPDGRKGVAEVFADHSPQWVEYLAFLKANPTIPAPELRRCWLVGVLCRPKLHTRRRDWVAAVGMLEAAGLTSMVDAPAQMKQGLINVGIGHANAQDGEPGVLALQRQVTADFSDGDTATLLSRYVDWLLEQNAKRKTDKLLAHPHPVDERHLFLWTTESSPMGIAWMLRSGAEDLHAHRAPNLPEGITHLWVAGRDPSTHTFEWSTNMGWRDWGLPPRNEADAIAWEYLNIV